MGTYYYLTCLACQSTCLAMKNLGLPAGKHSNVSTWLSVHIDCYIEVLNENDVPDGFYRWREEDANKFLK